MVLKLWGEAFYKVFTCKRKLIDFGFNRKENFRNYYYRQIFWEFGFNSNGT